MMNALTRIFLCLTLCFAVCLAASPPTACKAKLLGCPPGTMRMEKGKDEQGCPIHRCKRCPPLPVCSPSEKLKKAVVSKRPGGCPRYICEKACPTSIPECPACYIAHRIVDDYGCSRFICTRVLPRCRAPECPPNSHVIHIPTGDSCGCPRFLCGPV